MAWSDNKERPRIVTKKLAHAYQPYVDSIIRKLVHKGVSQENSIERALSLRDERIKKGIPPPQYGRKKKS